MKIMITMSSVLLLISSFSLQAETKYETAYGKCVDEAGTMNNSVMASCSEETSELAKKDIVTFYKNIEDKARNYDDSIEIIKMLEISQKSWIQYRDNNCELSEKISLHAPYCLMLINSQRAEELKNLAE